MILTAYFRWSLWLHLFLFTSSPKNSTVSACEILLKERKKIHGVNFQANQKFLTIKSCDIYDTTSYITQFYPKWVLCCRTYIKSYARDWSAQNGLLLDQTVCRSKLHSFSLIDDILNVSCEAFSNFCAWR